MGLWREARRAISVLIVLGFFLIPTTALASNQPSLTQTINNGSLTTDIYQSDDQTPVASPAISFPAVNRSFSCQTTTATLGDSNDKVNVTNLDSTNSTGWTLTMAATGGYTTTWTDGTDTYKFNDATGSGCTNGQLTVDPSVATLTDDCNSVCGNTGVTQGSSTAFDHSGGHDAVTLLSDSSSSAWEGYLTGIGLSQKIPAQQAAGSYTLGMTITVAAN